MKLVIKYEKIIITVLFVASILVLFLPCYKLVAMGDSYNANGFEVIFGYKKSNYQLFKFNVIGFISIIIGLFGLVATYIRKFKKDFLSYLSIILYLVSSILMFLTKLNIRLVQEGLYEYGNVTIVLPIIGFIYLLSAFTIFMCKLKDKE